MGEVQVIEDKIQALEECIKKMENESYVATVNIPEGMTVEDFIDVAKIRLNGAKAKVYEIEHLSGEEMAEAYAVTNSELDGVLAKFPEYMPIDTRLR